jgi:hypothetical protein
MKTNIKQLTEKLKSICQQILEIEDINQDEKYSYYARSIICHIMVKNFQINPHSFCKYLNVKKNEVDELTREAEIKMIKNDQDFKWAYSQIIDKI